MAEAIVKKDYYCKVLAKTVTVEEAYSFQGSGACPVSSALSGLNCEGETECRKKSLYPHCRLWDEYQDIYDS